MSHWKASGLDRSVLKRFLQTTALSLAVMTATAAGVHAQTVIGADGTPGTNCRVQFPGSCNGGNGGDGESVTASGNPATAIGGNGGTGGSAAFTEFGAGGIGGNGGAASATAAGSGSANANATGGSGGDAGDPGFSGFFPSGGAGGDATASSTAITRRGDATSSAAATGGAGGVPIFPTNLGGAGGDATATSGATSNGSGDATSSATATSGAAGAPTYNPDGDATATSGATSNGSGGALSSATATGGVGGFSEGVANATSTAETAKGGLAQALSTAAGSGGEAQSTAMTSFAGVRVQSTAVQPTYYTSTETNAIAQGGSGQAFVNPSQTAYAAYAFSTARPDKDYAATLIDGASNVANALLGPRDIVFGTAILGTNPGFGSYSASSKFDFRYRGDLLLGLIDGSGGFNIVANGVEILAESFVDNSVINLGSNLGPNIDLTFVTYGSGAFALGVGTVPESSTWAMMLVGFAGLALAGYRRAKAGQAAHAPGRLTFVRKPDCLLGR
jgi:hypothetical protein